jgi:predicted secreted hydrolase
MCLRLWLILLVLCLTGCVEKTPRQDPLQLGQLLGGSDVSGYDRATTPRVFEFPRDHGPHPTFRNEWWYLTGNLVAKDGHRLGYQVTFFRNALSPIEEAQSLKQQNPSQWLSDSAWMAHAAVSDLGNGQHLYGQRFSRSSPGLAGAQANPLRVWLDDWSLSGQKHWQLKVIDRNFAIELDLRSAKPPVLQGNKGLSQKGRAPGNASYYYSITRIHSRGKVRVGDVVYEVDGLSWFDREWSTSALDDDMEGWDWFALQFDDGRDLMYYQLREFTGGAHPNSQGGRVAANGQYELLSRNDIDLVELDHWRAPNGFDYAVRWRMSDRTTGEQWLIEAPVRNQYMDLAVKYWEGAVVIYGLPDRKPVGRGYLEMTRINPER